MKVKTLLRKEPRPQDVELPVKDEVARDVTMADVRISVEARMTIGQAMKDIAAIVKMPEADLIRRMQGKMQWREPSGMLTVSFYVPEVDADMYIDIPKEHWEFKDKDLLTH